MASVYLDNNATTKIAEEVTLAMMEVWNGPAANPASQHHAGQKARRQIDYCRQEILKAAGAETVGLSADRCLFTSGGTEANNLALFGLVSKEKTILVSPVEHPSITSAAAYLWSTNHDVQYLKVDSNGLVCLENLEENLQSKSVGLVCVMAANNETGVIQPIEKIARLAHHYGARVHCDAVQVFGKAPFNFTESTVDSLSISCHKFHGPSGIGALILKRNLPLRPMIFGGHQQDGFRPGTENLALATGFRVAVELFQKDLSRRSERMNSLRLLLENQLQNHFSEIVINGSGAERLPHTSNIAFIGLDRQAFLLAADFNDLCLSTGSACSSGSSEPSPVLVAMGCSKEVIDSSIRFSLAADTTQEEIELAIEKIVSICKNLKV